MSLCVVITPTFEILLHLASAFQQLGPLDGTSGEHGQVLRHQLLVGVIVKVLCSLKAIWIHSRILNKM